MTREEALSNVRSFIGQLTEDCQESIRELVPELKESEDERIRKCIRLCLDECVHSDIIRDCERDECLTYLEKQKEQIPSPLFKVGDRIKLKSEPKYPFREIIDIKNGAYYFDTAVHLPFKEQDKWEAEQKPAEWMAGQGVEAKVLQAFTDGSAYIECPYDGRSGDKVIVQIRKK